MLGGERMVGTKYAMTTALLCLTVLAGQVMRIVLQDSDLPGNENN